MKYERFEDLPVWQAAIELAKRVYDLTRDRFFNQPGDLRDQLRRSSLSVSNNIAEGFERGSTAELLAFLYIARGSCGETRSMLLFVERFPEAEHLKSQISNLRSQIISRIMFQADTGVGGQSPKQRYQGTAAPYRRVERAVSVKTAGGCVHSPYRRIGSAGKAAGLSGAGGKMKSISNFRFQISNIMLPWNNL
jgi:four helix bundle protein